MVLDISVGKIILTCNEIVIRMSSANLTTLQAARDAIALYGDSCVIAANGGESKWSFKLDSFEQIEVISHEMGIKIQ